MEPRGMSRAETNQRAVRGGSLHNLAPRENSYARAARPMEHKVRSGSLQRLKQLEAKHRTVLSKEEEEE